MNGSCFPGARKEEESICFFSFAETSTSTSPRSSDFIKKQKKQAAAKAAATLLTKYRGDAQLTAVRAFCLQQMGQGGEAVQVRWLMKFDLSFLRELTVSLGSGEGHAFLVSSISSHSPPPSPLPPLQKKNLHSSPGPLSLPRETLPAPTRWGSRPAFWPAQAAPRTPSRPGGAPPRRFRTTRSSRRGCFSLQPGASSTRRCRPLPCA